MQIYHQGSNKLSRCRASKTIIQFPPLQKGISMIKPVPDNKIIQLVIMFLEKLLEKELLEKLNLELTS
jgi:hypothetical protein